MFAEYYMISGRQLIGLAYVRNLVCFFSKSNHQWIRLFFIRFTTKELALSRIFFGVDLYVKSLSSRRIAGSDIRPLLSQAKSFAGFKTDLVYL